MNWFTWRTRMPPQPSQRDSIFAVCSVIPTPTLPTPLSRWAR
ncbi:hypothetical protein H4W80_004232 [Nonomuraea angiospora]|uniref:Uncharacterized protein n=1 Tax=Nonomuraea angiospora TaxID=46172 RepID=A0ABR9LZB3_9ACTN|nr:hypothetical protein [Nonomuraea angiospora]